MEKRDSRTKIVVLHNKPIAFFGVLVAVAVLVAKAPQQLWFRSDFCNGVKLHHADLESGSSRIGSVRHFGAVWTSIRNVAKINK